MSDRPKRKASEKASAVIGDSFNSKKSRFDLVSWLQDTGYEQFRATERYHSDGKKGCTAKLFYRTRNSGILKEMPIVKSGSGRSEVVAVAEFVRVKCDYDIAALYQYLEAGINGPV